jgi:hypothetical protein
MLSAVKTNERLRARELRIQGASVRDIERELGVARSTASRWVADIEMSPEARHALVECVTEGRLAAAQRKREAARRRRTHYQHEGRRRARLGDDSYAAGCMLYWAEGEKGRNIVGMSNADVGLLTYFATFLRRHFDVEPEKMKIHCNLFADHLERQEKIERFWLSALALPESSLRKSSVNVYSKYSLKKRVNKLPYGTCKLVVCNTRIVQTIYGSIQEYAGIERPEWL